MSKRKRTPTKASETLKSFAPKNEKQAKLIELIEDNEFTIVKGVPGSGKTYIALATALSLLDYDYKEIILVKSVTTIPGEDIGYLKGDYLEKMEPYMMSYTWNIDKIIGKGGAQDLIDKNLIRVLPIAFIRGLSIDNAIVIIDEAQNIDPHTFKTLISRTGENSKYIFLGDVDQIDRKKKNESCLEQVFRIFSDSDLIATLEFSDEDCVRNPKIPKILEKLRENNI